MHTVRTSTSARSRRLAVTALPAGAVALPVAVPAAAGAAEGGPVSKAQIERQEILKLEEQRRLAQLAEHYGLSKAGIEYRGRVATARREAPPRPTTSVSPVGDDMPVGALAEIGTGGVVAAGGALVVQRARVHPRAV